MMSSTLISTMRRDSYPVKVTDIVSRGGFKTYKDEGRKRLN